MDIQVNKDQLYRVVIKWLDKHYGDLIPKKQKYYPNVVFYVNSSNEIMIEYNKKSQRGKNNKATLRSENMKKTVCNCQNFWSYSSEVCCRYFYNKMIYRSVVFKNLCRAVIEM